MENIVTFRWLGVGGFELKCRHKTLLVDPYLSRIPLWNFLLGPVRKRRDVIRKYISECDAILVTHSHFDHVMDVPDIARNTGAQIYGSPNTCRIAELSGVAAEKIHEIQAGDAVRLDSFFIQVLPAGHAKLPFYPPKPLPSSLKLPLRALDYRLDKIFSFHIAVEGQSLFINPGYVNGAGLAADILLMHPYLKKSAEFQLLKKLRPRVIIPIHWDNHHRSLDKPLERWFRPPERSIRPLRRYKMGDFQRQIEGNNSGIRFFLPEILKPYDLQTIIDPASEN